jgi:hypothetical protein
MEDQPRRQPDPGDDAVQYRSLTATMLERGTKLAETGAVVVVAKGAADLYDAGKQKVKDVLSDGPKSK